MFRLSNSSLTKYLCQHHCRHYALFSHSEPVRPDLVYHFIIFAACCNLKMRIVDFAEWVWWRYQNRWRLLL